MTSYKISKTISNNIVLARDVNDHEVFLRGKGIGFGKRSGDRISSADVESLFSLVNPDEQRQYHQLLRTTSPRLVEIAGEMIDYIQSEVKKPLNEHIHVALTDHIAFLVRRCKMGIPIENPFSLETSTLYPKEFEIAAEVVRRVAGELNLRIPEGEAGFIALHIISSTNDKTLEHIQRENTIINKLVTILEDHIGHEIEKTSLNYVRLITHVRFVIERVQRKEKLDAPPELVSHVRQTYPQCYYLAWTMVRALQNEMHTKVNEAEAFYLSLHLYRYISAA